MIIPRSNLVSVVMPTYNQARFIGSAVESVLSQSRANFELIVIDNYSPDGTEAVISAFKDPRIKYMKFANNGIVAASRNYGIRMAKGEYVAFMDSDDLWLPDKLEKQAAAFLSPIAPVLVYSRFRVINGDAISDRVLPEKRWCLGGDAFQALYLKHFIACSGVMVKKTVLDRIGGFDEKPELLTVEDMDLWLRISLDAPVCCASMEPLFLYRVHPGNLSGGYIKKWKKAAALIIRFSGKAGFFNFVRAIMLLSFSILKQRLGRG
jgi:glycosyltransferase involved in cell wall biosynthesis